MEDLWETRVLRVPGVAERTGEIEQELREAQELRHTHAWVIIALILGTVALILVMLIAYLAAGFR